ncbi:MAG: hypothetical protein ACYTFV_04915 [Planctomycetota bacterium]
MNPSLVILAAYVLAVLALGAIAARRAGRTPEDYFLAGSGLGTVVLFMALFSPVGPTRMERRCSV